MHADEEDRHLERQLAQRAPAARARVPRAAHARPAADAGDEGRPGQVPRPRARRGGLPRRPPLRRALGGRRDRRAGRRSSSTDVRAGLDGEPDADEARWLEATAGALRVVTTYVPNGRAVDSPFYEGKLRFLDAAAERIRALVRRRARRSRATSTSARPTSTSTTRRRSSARPTSRRPSASASRRCSTPAPSTPSATLHPDEPGFTWWDYRAGPLPQEAGPADRRDPALAAGRRSGCSECGIDRNFRKGPKPSDHAPLLAEFQ